MPLKPRRVSATGTLHLIARGNNGQALFEEESDYKFFLSRLGRYCREASIRIHAYCLMENHVHLLVNDRENTVSGMMHNLTRSYSAYYNGKYEHNGHLFQGRFLSEPVENERYLFTVFRYILNNPVKAGICPAPLYRWSSYKAYFRENTPLDLGFIRDRFRTAESYREYLDAPDEEDCLDYTKRPHGDGQAMDIIRETCDVRGGIELQSWDRPARNNALQHLKKQGLTVRQIERLTGIGRGIIQRA